MIMKTLAIDIFEYLRLYSYFVRFSLSLNDEKDAAAINSFQTVYAEKDLLTVAIERHSSAASPVRIVVKFMFRRVNGIASSA